MSLKETVQENLITAIKAKEEIKVSTLRMLKAEIMKFEVSGGAKKEATDDDVLAIVQKSLKQRKDAAEQFRKGDRQELADKEDKEAEILAKYMPEQMGEDEVKAIVAEAISQVGASSKEDMGKVMGAVMPKVKGKADGKLVNQVVMQLLS